MSKNIFYRTRNCGKYPGLVIVMLLLALSGSCVQPSSINVTPTSPLNNCMTVDNHPPEQITYSAPLTITEGEITASLKNFERGDKTWVIDGSVQFVDSMKTQNTTSLFLNNANLGFEFVSPECITLDFCDAGGNINLAVNDVFVNEDDFTAMTGPHLNGVDILVEMSEGGCGMLMLRGDFQDFDFLETGTISFAVGGSELYLDNICVCGN